VPGSVCRRVSVAVVIEVLDHGLPVGNRLPYDFCRERRIVIKEKREAIFWIIRIMPIDRK
jgi:hypothetical protein